MKNLNFIYNNLTWKSGIFLLTKRITNYKNTNSKWLLLLFFVFLITNLKAQSVELSPNKNYFAAYFMLKKDSVVYVKENNEYKETKATFAKYKISIFDAISGKELHFYETKLFQLQANKPSIKMFFTPNSEFLYFALENKDVLVFSMHKGFISKYLAQDFFFIGNENEFAFLKPDEISFSASDKKITRDLSNFTNLELIAENQFALVSRVSKNKYTSALIEIANPKNDKIIKYEAWSYNPEEKEFICLNSSKIVTYKLPTFKEKEVELDKEYKTADYKKNYYLARFNSNATALMLIGDEKISILSAKGKSIADIKIPDNFSSITWIDNENLRIVSLSEISIFNLKTKKVSTEAKLEFDISNQQKLSNFSEVLHVSSTAKYAALSAFENVELKNTNIDKQISFKQQYFLNFSSQEDYFFTQNSNFEIKAYSLANFSTENKAILLKTEPFKFLSAIGGAFYKIAKTQNYYNSDFKSIGIPFTMLEVDSISALEGESFQGIYDKFQKDKNLKYASFYLNTRLIDAISLFDLQTKTSKNITINSLVVKTVHVQIDANFFANPLIRQNYLDQYKSKENERLESNLNSENAFWNGGKNNAIHNLKFTNHNTILYHKLNDSRYKVTDIELNEELDYLAMGEIFFSPNNAFVVVSAALKTILYNTLKGTEMRSYSDIYTNILLTNDTTFFVGMNKSSNYFFVGLTKKIDLQTSIAKITPNGKYLLTLSKDRTLLKRYSLPEMKELSSVKIPDSHKRYFYTPLIEASENGEFISAQYKNELSFFSTQTDNDANNIKTIENVSSEKGIYWLNDQEALIIRDESSIVLNVKNGNYNQQRDFNFYLSDNELKTNSLYLLFISNNAQFAVIQHSSDENVMLVKNTNQKYNYFKIRNAKFIAFDSESKRIFFQIGTSRLGILETSTLLDTAGSDFSYETIRAANRQNRQLPPRPKPIAFDSPAPEGYHYERFTQEKSFGSDPKIKAGIYVHNLISEGNDVKLNVHVLDKKGNFYSGIDSKTNKDVWCELYIKYPDGSTKRIENFEVTENNSESQQTPTNYALGLVLDHSGSMGNERCNYLQKGVKSFIEQKSEFVAVSLLKFDENVKTQINLSNSKANLLKKLELTGDKGFGGSTALYDAIYEGIFEVNKAEKTHTKAILVVTDGYENASYTYLNELILFALEHNVKVYTVGFGAYVNKPILQTIAYQTGGSFYQIYKTQELEWIYQDIYNKLSNYYSIRFATPQKGKYTLMLKPCSEKIDNQIFIAFDNNEIDYKKLTEFQHDGFGIPFLDMSDSLQVSVFEAKEPISSIDRIVSKNGSNLDFYAPREFDKIKFPDIKFVTDKTEIIKDTDKGLQEVISFLEKYPKIIIEISGHTDEVGTNEKNLDLSHRRADKIKEIMVKGGIDANRILTAGYGETKPIASNTTAEGKLKNRRVEFKIINSLTR